MEFTAEQIQIRHRQLLDKAKGFDELAEQVASMKVQIAELLQANLLASRTVDGKELKHGDLVWYDGVHIWPTTS